MAFARTLSVGLTGVQGHVVEVEADLAQGLPGFVITGLPDVALSEARDRVRAAVHNSGETWPSRRITVGLTPAWLPKHGTGYDLAVAVAVLVAAEVVPRGRLEGVVLLGELALDGQVRPVRGVLPAVLAAARHGIERVVVPSANGAEARLVPGLRVLPVASLRALAGILRGEPVEEEHRPALAECGPPPVPDLVDVVGQDDGRRAVEVAAAGGHHLTLTGPPGSGKTMLAERLPGLLPPLDLDAALEVTAVHSVAGVLPAGSPLVRRPPYQAPHHTATVPALVGGGSGLARPGALSLAHRGVLFLDEAPEFAGGVLDALRQPLERGEIVLARAGGVATYPCRVQLVLASNPCACRSGSGDLACTCSPAARRRYGARLSGPLLDRVDLQVTLLPVRGAALLSDASGLETTATVASRVARARAAAAARWSGDGWRTNAEVPGGVLRGRPWGLPRAARLVADRLVETGELSARGYHRVLRVAWTIADLAGRDRPDSGDVLGAAEFRLGRAA